VRGFGGGRVQTIPVLEYVQCKLCMQVSRGSGHRTRDGGGNNRAQVSPGSTKDGRY